MRLCTPKCCHGFSLIEVALALGICGFALVSILALLPIGLSSNQQSLQQTTANNILSAIITDLATLPKTTLNSASTTSNQFQIRIPNQPVSNTETSHFFTTSHGKTTTNTPQASYRVTVTVYPNASTPSTTIHLQLTISWPAALDSKNATGDITNFLALDRS